jgi:hypothetical protein
MQEAGSAPTRNSTSDTRREPGPDAHPVREQDVDLQRGGGRKRWDGTGYPDGLAGEAIPLIARIVCACDACSAMTTNRPYRRALSSAAAIAELRSCSGTQFDPRVVELVIELLDEGQESSVLESVDSVSALTEPDRLAAAG